jgi:hypothetical protein
MGLLGAGMDMGHPAPEVIVPCNCCRSKALCSMEPLRREAAGVPWRFRGCCCGGCWGRPLCVVRERWTVIGKAKSSSSRPLTSLRPRWRVPSGWEVMSFKAPTKTPLDQRTGVRAPRRGPERQSGATHPPKWGTHRLTTMGSGAWGGDCWSSCWS